MKGEEQPPHMGEETISCALEPYLSPSLASNPGKLPAYEIKFLLPTAEALELQAWAADRFGLDPHGQPELNGGYQTCTIYLDTPELSVFHRLPSYRRTKYRVRQYGNSAELFFERKSKSQGRVEKLRFSLPSELALDVDTVRKHTLGENTWFVESMQKRNLAPRLLVRYDRTAYVSLPNQERIRLTFDRNLFASTWNSLSPGQADLTQALEDRVIFEMKFVGAMPAELKRLAQSRRLHQSIVSKYRSGVSAVGLDCVEVRS